MLHGTGKDEKISEFSGADEARRCMSTSSVKMVANADLDRANHAGNDNYLNTRITLTKRPR